MMVDNFFVNVVCLLYTADTIMIVGGLLFPPLTYYPPLSIDCGGVGRCTRILSAWGSLYNNYSGWVG